MIQLTVSKAYVERLSVLALFSVPLLLTGELQARFAETEKSWLVDIADVACESFDLSVKNPNKAEDSLLREPQEILDEIAALDAESTDILAVITGMVCS